MLRPWLAVALFLSLAGCSSGQAPAETAPTTPAQSAGTSTVGVPIAPILLTDTMHFLDAPHMAGTLPANGEAFRTPVYSDLHSFPEAPVFASWRLPQANLAEVRSVLHLEVDIQGVVTPYAYPIGLHAPNGQACFWWVTLHFEGQDPRTGIASDCIQEPTVIPMGRRALDFTLPEVAIDLSREDRIMVSVWTAGIYSPNASVHILSGTPDADSTLTIERLQLPLTTMTLTH